MARREDTGRQPQFTNTQYEIPSWQTPWNKPWYQRTDSKNDDIPNQYKYNARGHLNDCTCSNCEDDLEKAFSPDANAKRQSVSDIPQDRREDITIQVHLEDLSIINGGEASSTVKSSEPKKVFLFSELAEVTPSTSSNSLATVGSVPTSNSCTPSQDCASTSGNMTHDSVMEVFGNLAALETISKQTKDIESRVYNYSGPSTTQEYKTMKDLLLTLMKELSRIHSNVEWFAISKRMALDAIRNTLQVLEQKAKQAERS